jgi:hypothetical protein
MLFLRPYGRFVRPWRFIIVSGNPYMGDEPITRPAPTQHDTVIHASYEIRTQTQAFECQKGPGLGSDRRFDALGVANVHLRTDPN